MPCLIARPATPRRRFAPPNPVRSDDEIIAYLLIGTWALATGRSLPSDIPLDQLSEQELIDFWADPLIGQEAPGMRPHVRPPRNTESSSRAVGAPDADTAASGRGDRAVGGDGQGISERAVGAPCADGAPSVEGVAVDRQEACEGTARGAEGAA